MFFSLDWICSFPMDSSVTSFLSGEMNNWPAELKTEAGSWNNPCEHEVWSVMCMVGRCCPAHISPHSSQKTKKRNMLNTWDYFQLHSALSLQIGIIFYFIHYHLASTGTLAAASRWRFLYLGYKPHQLLWHCVTARLCSNIAQQGDG